MAFPLPNTPAYYSPMRGLNNPDITGVPYSTQGLPSWYVPGNPQQSYANLRTQSYGQGGSVSMPSVPNNYLQVPQMPLPPAPSQPAQSGGLNWAPGATQYQGQYQSSLGPNGQWGGWQYQPVQSTLNSLMPSLAQTYGLNQRR